MEICFVTFVFETSHILKVFIGYLHGMPVEASNVYPTADST
jgi:hypothetical protein